ncbi:MAG TPA: hypothetical protein VK465_14860, partial [Fibrobacteria bacterium]|nr:hypothetical protein [Fibrobacteria bacterium]
MRKACLIFSFTVSLAAAALGQISVQPTVKPAAQPDTLGSRREDSTDSIGMAPSVPPTGAQVADTARAVDTAAAVAETLETPAPAPHDRTAVPTLPPPPASRALINDWPLAARQYGFGIAGQAVAGALGFFIGSAIETAFEGEDNAHKGTLSFSEIRYDNFHGAFWGASMAGMLGSSLTVYFTGQSDEEDGGFFCTMVGAGLAGAGALYVAHLMGVNDEPDWKP